MPGSLEVTVLPDEIPGWSNSDMFDLYDEVAAVLFSDLCTVVEVGVAYGRSLAYLAQALKNDGVRIVGVDTFHEHIGQDNLPPEVSKRMMALGTPIEAVRHNLKECGLLERVELMHMPSVSAAGQFAPESCDFVFIDADHRYPGVRADIAAWYPKVRSGGILAGDDYDLDTYPGVVAAVEDAFGDCKRTIHGRVWKIVKP